MLVGIINNETINEHYFIHLDKIDNYNELSIIHVNNTTTEYLSKENAIDLLKTLLSSKLTFKEKENDYDIYLDEANNKRYFKNGKENYFKFLINNGEEAIYYMDKINKKNISIPKRYKLIVNSMIISMTLTSILSIPLTNDIHFLNIGKRIISNFHELDDEEIVYLMKKSPYLSETDKGYLCNEDYFKFVLSYSNTNDRSYYLREKFNNINIKYYDKEKDMQLEGYYQTLDINTIHIAEQAKNNEEFRRNVMTHEFIHLTQCDSRYTYLIEGTAEIIKNEFYDIPIVSYQELVARTKVLMEIIGPEPILECIYKKDDSKLVSEINKYLDKKDTEKLLNLFTGNDIYKEIYKTQDINNEIDILLKKLYENKTNKKIQDDQMISLIYSNEDQGRIYFNYNSENYNRDFRLDDEIEYMSKINVSEVFDSDKVESYNYPYNTVEEINGEKVNYHTTITTEDFSSIPLNEINFINIIFKDGTIGHAMHDIDNDKWSMIERYRIVERYEPSIAKKFNIKNTELDSILLKEDETNNKKVL